MYSTTTTTTSTKNNKKIKKIIETGTVVHTLLQQNFNGWMDYRELK